MFTDNESIKIVNLKSTTKMLIPTPNLFNRSIHAHTRPPARLSFNFLLTRTQLGHLRFEYIEQNSDCDFTILLLAHMYILYAHKLKLFIVPGKELCVYALL